MKRTLVVPLALLAAFAVTVPLAGSPAHAQQKEFSLQKFLPAAHSLGTFQVEAARVSHQLTINGFFVFDYARALLQDTAGDSVVDSFATIDVIANVAFFDHFSFAVDLPLHMLRSGDFLDGEEIEPFGVGDVRLSLKAAVLRPHRIGPGAAFSLDILVPSGSSGGLGREEGLTVIPRFCFDAVARGVHLMTNVFAVVRSEENDAVEFNRPVAGTDLGPHFEIGNDVGMDAGLAIFLGSTDLRMIIETRFQSRWDRWFEPDTTQLEIGGGLHWRHPKIGIGVGAAGYGGLLEGYGDPDWRVIFTAGYQPGRYIPEPVAVVEEKVGDRDNDGVIDPRDPCPDEPEDMDGFEDDDGCPDRDNDKDGVLDENDQCPIDPEDVDGWQDSDGCSEADNDGDGILDLSDKCPNQAEDMDGDRDQDGCPDGDADGDGFPDDKDKCPSQAEDVDGFEDQDGCPEPDNDKDGLLDAADKCPIDAEDKDGFEDADGCPDPDNDKDGIADAADKCPDKAEDFDGCQDEDGCPETGRVCVTREKIVISDKIYFATNRATIKEKSYSLLAEIADVLKQNPHIKLVEIQGHTDSQGSSKYNKKLSEARAKSVRDHLVQRLGVDAGRLTAVGYGEDRPIEDNHTAAGREANRRVEFVILKQDLPSE